MNNYIKKYWIVLLLLLGVGSFGGWYYFFYDPNYCYKNQTYLTDEQYIDIAVHELDDTINQDFVGHSSYEKIKIYLKKYPQNVYFYRDKTNPKQFEWIAFVSIVYVFDEDERKKMKEKNNENVEAFAVNFTFDGCGNYVQIPDTSPQVWIKNCEKQIRKEMSCEQPTSNKWIENTQIMNKEH